MECQTVGCESSNVVARGLCRRCYQRQRRNGTVDRKNLVRSAHCVSPGCARPVFGRNLCTLHYQRGKHPLSTTWKLLRSRQKGAYPPAWDDFGVFLGQVGNRPTEKHQLRRINADLPWSVANIHWVSPIGLPIGSTRGGMADYQREWNFQRRFGITGAQYAEMLEAQGGNCAVCLQPERVVDHRHNDGSPRALAVDHDHETGAVRGLLCRDCNTALGLFDDDATVLRAALAYIEKHAAATGRAPPD